MREKAKCETERARHGRTPGMRESKAQESSAYEGRLSVGQRAKHERERATHKRELSMT
tara:strand:- start:25 stop:198 length:174 start_codon:yes stop_codon:yes gene_type:complete